MNTPTALEHLVAHALAQTAAWPQYDEAHFARYAATAVALRDVTTRWGELTVAKGERVLVCRHDAQDPHANPRFVTVWSNRRAIATSVSEDDVAIDAPPAAAGAMLFDRIDVDMVTGVVSYPQVDGFELDSAKVERTAVLFAGFCSMRDAIRHAVHGQLTAYLGASRTLAGCR